MIGFRLDTGRCLYPFSSSRIVPYSFAGSTVLPAYPVREYASRGKSKARRQVACRLCACFNNENRQEYLKLAVGRLRITGRGLDYSILHTFCSYGKRLLYRDGTMSMDDSYVAKTQAIRACVAQRPGVAPQRIVELLAAGGMRVSPAHVIVIQTLERSERADQVPAAS